MKIFFTHLFIAGVLVTATPLTTFAQVVFGCTNPQACNYNPAATVNDSNCVFPGCTHSTACNYNPLAGCDDGSCTGVKGCTSATACNYNSSATCNDGSCTGTKGCRDSLACNFNLRATCDDGSCVSRGCTNPAACNYNPAAGCSDGSCHGTKGCRDSLACNFNFKATCDDGSCVLRGCTDTAACNYNPAAGCSNGTCVYPGCTRSTACNYNPLAGCDDGSCTGVKGCTNATACNYNSAATCDDGSCIVGIKGCRDSLACNFNLRATCDDGSCISRGCTNPAACNYNPAAGCSDGSCHGTKGCRDSLACNFNFKATCDDGSCVLRGCTDTAACNYNPAAGCSDGSCVYPGCTRSTACNYNALAGCDNGTCSGVKGCTSATACNYNSAATCDDGSCSGTRGCRDSLACNFNLRATCIDNSFCTYHGCTDTAACNYNPAAGCNDGSCTYPGCTNPTACNYNAHAGCDNGTCLSGVKPVVTISANPDTAICLGTLVTFTATPVNGGSTPSYQWLKNGFPVGANSNVYKDSALTNGNTITCNMHSNASCVSPATVSGNSLVMIVNSAPPSTSLTGPAQVCKGQAGVVYTAGIVAGASAYTWTLPAGATGSSSSNTITVSFSNTFAGGNICVRASNGCGPGLSTCQGISISQKPTPPVIITGAATVCPNTQQVYSIAAVTGATSYTWTAPAGATIISGQGSTSVTVQFPVNYANSAISVVANNCAGSSGSTKLAVKLQPATAAPGAISGPAMVCPNTQQVYFIAADSGATSYTWTAPVGATITSGQGSTSVTVQFPVNYANSTISVVANNCAGSSGNTKLAVKLQAIPARPDTIIGATAVCSGSTGLYFIAAVSGATGYVWTAPAGATILTGQNTVSVNVQFPANYTNSSISVVTTGCSGNSNARNLNVKLQALPGNPGAVSGPTSACKATTETYSIAPDNNTDSYTWTLPAGTAISGVQDSAAINLAFLNSFAGGNLSVAVGNCSGSKTSKNLRISLSTGCVAGPTKDEQVQDSVFVADQLNVYPNPSDGRVTMDIYRAASSPVDVVVINVVGQIVYEYSLTDAASHLRQTIDLSPQPAGIYFMRVKSGEAILNKEIIIQR